MALTVISPTSGNSDDANFAGTHSPSGGDFERLTIDNLHNEIFVYHIFNFLTDLKSICAAERVCKRWRQLVHVGLQHVSFYGLIRPSVEFVSKIMKLASRLKSVEFASVSDELALFLFMERFPSVKSLSILDADGLNNLYNLGKAFPNLERLAAMKFRGITNSSMLKLTVEAFPKLKAVAFENWPQNFPAETLLESGPALRDIICCLGSSTHLDHVQEVVLHFNRRPYAMRTAIVDRIALSRDLDLVLTSSAAADTQQYETALEHVRRVYHSGEMPINWYFPVTSYPYSALERITFGQNRPFMREFLALGANPNIVLQRGNIPPIFIVLHQLDLESFDLLLEPEWGQFIDLRARIVSNYVSNLIPTNVTFTPLLWLCYLRATNEGPALEECLRSKNWTKFHSAINALLDNGASVNAKVQPVKMTYYSDPLPQITGHNALTILLRYGANVEDRSLMKELIRRGARLPLNEDRVTTPVTFQNLCLPIMWKDFTLFKMLFDVGAAPFYSKDAPMLLYALEVNALDIAQFLVPHVAAHIVDSDAASEIITACVKRDVSTVLESFIDAITASPQGRGNNLKPLKELLPAALIEEWLADPARKLVRTGQFKSIEILLKNQMVFFEKSFFDLCLNESIAARNSPLAEFAWRHGARFHSEELQANALESMAKFIFFMPRSGDIWNKILGATSFSKATWQSALAIAKQKRNQYMQMLLLSHCERVMGAPVEVESQKQKQQQEQEEQQSSRQAFLVYV